MLAPILIGSAPSSGSTLLVNAIERNFPSVVSGPEISLFSHPFVWRESGEAWRRGLLEAIAADSLRRSNYLDEGFVPYAAAVYPENLEAYGRSIGDLRTAVAAMSGGNELFQWLFEPLVQPRSRVLIEKSPPNIYSIPAFLKCVPDGRALLIVRDGRDVVCSLKGRGFTFTEALRVWLIEAGICHTLALDPRVHLIKYEDLTADPAGVLDHVGKALNLGDRGKADVIRTGGRVDSWTLSPNDQISTSAVGRWKSDLTDLEQVIFGAYRVRVPAGSPIAELIVDGTSCGDLLANFGYAASDARVPQTTDILAHAAMDDEALADRHRAGGFHRAHVVLDATSVPTITRVEHHLTGIVAAQVARVRAREELRCQVAGLNALASETEGRRAAVEHLARQQGITIEELGRRIAERDRLAATLEATRAALEHKLSQGDLEIARLGEEITSRDRLLAQAEEKRCSLERMLAEREAANAELGRTVACRDEMLASLEALRGALDCSLGERTTALNEAENQLITLKASHQDIAARLHDAERVMNAMRSPLSAFSMAWRNKSADANQIRQLTEQLHNTNELANSIEATRAKLEGLLSERDKVIADLSARNGELIEQLNQAVQGAPRT